MCKFVISLFFFILPYFPKSYYISGTLCAFMCIDVKICHFSFFYHRPTVFSKITLFVMFFVGYIGFNFWTIKKESYENKPESDRGVELDTLEPPICFRFWTSG